jgi:hypothetical protein
VDRPFQLSEARIMQRVEVSPHHQGMGKREFHDLIYQLLRLRFALLGTAASFYGNIAAFRPPNLAITLADFIWQVYFIYTFTHSNHLLPQ